MSILPEPNPAALLDTPDLLRRRRKAALAVAARCGEDPDLAELLEALGLKAYVGMDRPDRVAGGTTGSRAVMREGLGAPSSWPTNWRTTSKERYEP